MSAYSTRREHHDHAGPDAASQGLAQVEPGARGAGVHHLLHPRVPGPRRRRPGRRRLDVRHGRHGGRPRDHRLRVPAGLPDPDPDVPRRLRREHQRADAEAARHRPADPPADGGRAGVAGRGEAPGDRRVGRRARAADHAATPRSRRTGSSSATTATRRCCGCSGRRCPPTSSSAACATASWWRSCARRSRSGSRWPTRTSSRSSSGATRR